MPLRVSACDAQPPSYSNDVDLDAHLSALPHDGTCKGLFLRDAIRCAKAAQPEVDLFREAGMNERRILPFFDYPYGDLLRLLVAAARIAWPRLPPGEGLRRLGRSAFLAMADQQIGRVMFHAFIRDFGRLLDVGSRAWGVAVSFGEVQYQRLGDGHGTYRFEGLAGFIDSYQLGVVEGAMQWCGATGEVWVRRDSVSKGTLEFWWE
ncbi:MAG: DUF2378 family protein [Sandaracinaceae bacterium]